MKKREKNLFVNVIGVVLTSFLVTSNIANAQQANISRLTEPEKAKGFITWLTLPNAESYLVKILQETNNGVNVIGTNSTSNDYYKIDPSIMQIPDIGYVIEGINAEGSYIGTSDTVWSLATGDLGADLMCSKTCVSNTYTWKLNCWSNITSQTTNAQNEIVNTYGSDYLQFTAGQQYYDPTFGNYTPYWQGVSSNSWLNMQNNNHPYTKTYSGASDGTFHYGLYTSFNMSQNMVTGPFYDANGYQITSGKIVEKKMDQFIGFSGALTDNNIDFPDCSYNTSGWLSFFNAHNTENTSNFPSTLQWFNGGTTPYSISCNGQFIANNDTITNNWNTFWDTIYANVTYTQNLLDENSGNNINWSDFVNLHTDIANLTNEDGSISITGFTINSVTSPSVSAEISSSNELRLISSQGDITPGVYKIIIYTSDGNAILSYYSISSSIPQAAMSEFVSISVEPNPISGGNINLDVESVSVLNGTLIVMDVNGNLLHNENVHLDPGMTNINFTVNTNMIQLFVSLVLADGSIIQKQVLNY